MKQFFALFLILFLFHTAKGQAMYCNNANTDWYIMAQLPYHDVEPISVGHYLYLFEIDSKNVSIKYINLKNSNSGTVYKSPYKDNYSTFNIGSHLIISSTTTDSTTFYLIKEEKIIDSTTIEGNCPYQGTHVFANFGVVEIWSKKNQKLYVIDSTLKVTKIKGSDNIHISAISDSYVVVGTNNTTFLLNRDLDTLNLNNLKADQMSIFKDHVYYSNNKNVNSFSIKNQEIKSILSLNQDEYVVFNQSYYFFTFEVVDSTKASYYTVDENQNAQLVKSFSNNEYGLINDVIFTDHKSDKLRLFDAQTNKYYNKALQNDTFDLYRYPEFGNRENNEAVFSVHSLKNKNHTFWKFSNAQFKPIGVHNYQGEDSTYIQYIFNANNEYYYITTSKKENCLFKLKEIDFNTKIRSFNDLNNNGKIDSNEYYFRNTTFQIDSIMSLSGPFESIAIDDNAKHIKLIYGKNWIPTTDSIFQNSGDSVYFFGLIASKISTSVNGYFGINSTRCNQPCVLRPKIINEGNNNISGLLYLELDSVLKPDSFSINPDSIVGNNYWWKISDIRPSRFMAFNIYSKMPSVEYINRKLKTNLTFSIETAFEEDTVIVIDTIPKTIKCAYDPNDKTVWPQRVGQNLETLFGETLTYRIRFQNTGNDTAFNIIIADTIDYKLSLPSLKVIDNSHKMSVEITDDRVVRFIFRDILLPDSNVNEPASHGYVYYKIKAHENISENSIIKNKAHIFFDFNPDIITNTTLNIMVSEFTSINKITEKNSKISVYPNPTNGILNIVLENDLETIIKIFTVNGKEIIKASTNSQTHQISLTNLSPGLYILQVTQNGNQHFCKILIE